MTDVLLSHEADGGSITYTNGKAVLSDGLEAASYLSMFGGNENDSGDEADDSKQWWGNLSERQPERRHRSATQALLRSLPIIPANLLRLEEAAVGDHAWMIDTGLASFVRVTASIPTVNRIDLLVQIVIDDELFKFPFTDVSRAAA